LEERHITLQLTEAARTRLVRTGYDPHYGARPLKRAIQKEIENPLARKIVGGDIKDGQVISIDADPNGSGLVWRLQTPASEPVIA
jgi:ATP-dependent Clp protease ATP-binding subunit ClpB